MKMWGVEALRRKKKRERRSHANIRLRIVEQETDIMKNIFQHFSIYVIFNMKGVSEFITVIKTLHFYIPFFFSLRSKT